MSHPAWVCGLKRFKCRPGTSTPSHTLRGCVDWNTAAVVWVTPIPKSHPAWVCGLKLDNGDRKPSAICGHTLRGCVDWNYGKIGDDYFIPSHTLRGCVDWNSCARLSKLLPVVTPCVGVWIETLSSSVISSETGVTPCVGVWIETTAQTGKLFVPKVTPCVGVWIETILQDCRSCAV